MLEATGLARAPLTALVNGERPRSRGASASLLAAMKEQLQAGQAAAARHHRARRTSQTRFAAAGCEMESFDYRRVMDTTDGVPWVVETAFGWCPRRETRAGWSDRRQLVARHHQSVPRARPLRPEPRHDPQSSSGPTATSR